VSHDIFIPEDVRTLAVFVGAPSWSIGVKGSDGKDGTDDPSEFVAVTVNVYGVPNVKPETLTLVTDTVAVIPGGLETTV
jgi:hypothetical protein